MNRLADLKPNWNSAPGNTIIDILNEKSISINEFEKEMGLSKTKIKGLLNGQNRIDEKIAIRLQNTLGASSDFWINRENQFREVSNYLSSIEDEQNLWVKTLPIKDMLNFGWIKKSENLFQDCLSFFNVPDIETWNLKYNINNGNPAFRISPNIESKSTSIATWLRKGELIAENIKCDNWNKELFIDKLDEIKKLTREKNPRKFIPELISICASCGVAVAIVPTPKGCPASGVTKFISNQKALLQLSFRYLRDDNFWFTFFHEAGHLILHEKNRTHIEVTDRKAYVQSDEEMEANSFASEVLIPYNFKGELKTIKSNKRKLIEFASKMGISPGIVVGQMQYNKIVSPQYLNGYKRFFKWDEINDVLNY
ncbi:ImmA/IrrE family metallo-endopeptidase [Maribacter sp. 1_2014MBL_MicDiv]|uniref:ImmA/IrrE family metallo-endopeptidase n=1 Tax=Maribacter sp. 1_2014MBL_MicDiv TaxID=1644130 RepID=UPI0008F47366|nr:ImmA/IrrE family metallo-endopeptidase [Maribacter sp. 1_2014MBL_MicDiv]APA64252.1 hypothetical protein YQ22_07915 [Maribacter sp. 1_2014MBL_MicDiv]